ncbi:substrate-binding domain-containing protein [Cupriavidus sp. WKF15]|uniref:substrate-binding domain-containing protein n=1 Tax=Cupriavidus sp. WKF15 TaxID=3032282 RepID=UPI0023E2CADF|nr:substrate-binding domain-containing protein [Cupriavidus sp. WKF15]WER48473.1 substrate-binding domain-containing protein [Cupriavidus sp. WKF15]
MQAAGLAQFPLVVGGVVPVVNLDGVGAGQVRLTGALLAGIFQGKIVNWNDPTIAQANPGIAGVVFVLMPRGANANGVARDALAFFRWALREGQADAAVEHYVALPPALVEQVEAYWGQWFKPGVGPGAPRGDP